MLEDVSLRRSASSGDGGHRSCGGALIRDKLARASIQPISRQLACKGHGQNRRGLAGITISAPRRSNLLGQKCLEPNPVVQRPAVMALGEMGSLALPALESALQDDDLAVIMATLNGPGPMNHARASYWSNSSWLLEPTRGRQH